MTRSEQILARDSVLLRSHRTVLVRTSKMPRITVKTGRQIPVQL